MVVETETGANLPTPLPEAFIREFHPSISSTGIGAMLGRLYESMPRITAEMRWSHLLFCIPTSPIAAGLWLWLKGVGERYVLTTAAVERRRNIGDGPIERIELARISDVRVEVAPGDRFFRAGTLLMIGAEGQTLAKWSGVSDPASVQRTILDAVRGIREVEALRRAIAARAVPAA